MITAGIADCRLPIADCAPLQSAIVNRQSAIARRSAFTLIEFLTTVAILIIVLGLMVSLARYVREKSAEQLTRELLQRLEDVTRDYVTRTGHLPDVPPILQPDDLRGSETAVQTAARANNARFVEVMRSELARVELRELSPGGGAGNSGTGGSTDLRSNLEAADRPRRGMLGDLPISLYNGRTLADAWGHPIVFMPDQHPAIGMAPLRTYESNNPQGGSATPAPGDRDDAATIRERSSFFVSAGPDGRYLTREDNLYSYEGARR